MALPSSASAAWQNFVTSLRDHGYSFEDIQYTTDVTSVLAATGASHNSMDNSHNLSHIICEAEWPYQVATKTIQDSSIHSPDFTGTQLDQAGYVLSSCLLGRQGDFIARPLHNGPFANIFFLRTNNKYVPEGGHTSVSFVEQMLCQHLLSALSQSHDNQNNQMMSQQTRLLLQCASCYAAVLHITQHWDAGGVRNVIAKRSSKRVNEDSSPEGSLDGQPPLLSSLLHTELQRYHGFAHEYFCWLQPDDEIFLSDVGTGNNYGMEQISPSSNQDVRNPHHQMSVLNEPPTLMAYRDTVRDVLQVYSCVVGELVERMSIRRDRSRHKPDAPCHHKRENKNQINQCAQCTYERTSRLIQGFIFAGSIQEQENDRRGDVKNENHQTFLMEHVSRWVMPLRLLAQVTGAIESSFLAASMHSHEAQQRDPEDSVAAESSPCSKKNESIASFLMSQVLLRAELVWKRQQQESHMLSNNSEKHHCVHEGAHGTLMLERAIIQRILRGTLQPMAEWVQYWTCGGLSPQHVLKNNAKGVCLSGNASSTFLSQTVLSQTQFSATSVVADLASVISLLPQDSFIRFIGGRSGDDSLRGVQPKPNGGSRTIRSTQNMMVTFDEHHSDDSHLSGGDEAELFAETESRARSGRSRRLQEDRDPTQQQQQSFGERRIRPRGLCLPVVADMQYCPAILQPLAALILNIGVAWIIVKHLLRMMHRSEMEEAQFIKSVSSKRAQRSSDVIPQSMFKEGWLKERYQAKVFMASVQHNISGGVNMLRFVPNVQNFLDGWQCDANLVDDEDMHSKDENYCEDSDCDTAIKEDEIQNPAQVQTISHYSSNPQGGEDDSNKQSETELHPFSVEQFRQALLQEQARAGAALLQLAAAPIVPAMIGRTSLIGLFIRSLPVVVMGDHDVWATVVFSLLSTENSEPSSTRLGPSSFSNSAGLSHWAQKFASRPATTLRSVWKDVTTRLIFLRHDEYPQDSIGPCRISEKHLLPFFFDLSVDHVRRGSRTLAGASHETSLSRQIRALLLLSTNSTACMRIPPQYRQARTNQQQHCNQADTAFSSSGNTVKLLFSFLPPALRFLLPAISLSALQECFGLCFRMQVTFICMNIVIVRMQRRCRIVHNAEWSRDAESLFPRLFTVQRTIALVSSAFTRDTASRLVEALQNTLISHAKSPLCVDDLNHGPPPTEHSLVEGCEAAALAYHQQRVSLFGGPSLRRVQGWLDRANTIIVACARVLGCFGENERRLRRESSLSSARSPLISPEANGLIERVSNAYREWAAVNSEIMRMNPPFRAAAEMNDYAK